MNANKEFNLKDRIFAREELVYNVTEDLLVILEDLEVNKKELARRLGKSRSYVTQILSGSRNMTLGSFSDICFALGFKPEINLPVQDEPVIIVKKTKPLNSAWITQEKGFNRYSEVISQSINVIDRRESIHWDKVA